VEDRPLARDKKTTDGTTRVIGYADEAAFYLVPSVGLTWARKGQTPVLREGDRYGHLAVISLITATGDLHYQIQDGSYHGEDIVRFLRQLRETYPTTLTMIWDGATIHRGEAVTTFLQTENHGILQLEQLPAYSPELNADEQVWAYIKEHELSNLCCKTCDELKPHVVAAFERLKQQPDLIRSFFKHPQVGFY
jgi:transposase